MTNIRNAKIGDSIRWAYCGCWCTGFVHDVMPPKDSGQSARILIIDHGGKFVALTVEKLINCQAHVTAGGLCE